MWFPKTIVLTAVAAATVQLVPSGQSAAQAGTMGDVLRCSETCHVAYLGYGPSHQVTNFGSNNAGWYEPDETGGWFFWDCTNHPYGCNIGEALLKVEDLQKALRANDMSTIHKQLRAFGPELIINTGRSAIQILDCQGKSVIAHIEVPKAMTDDLQRKFADRVYRASMRFAAR